VREELADDPLELLARWVADAEAAGLPTPTAMTLATADADAVPHARTVLVTGIGPRSLRFHSSKPTTKTCDLAANPRACGVFHWPALGRQLVLHGRADEAGPAESRAAFVTRPRPLRLLAWVYEALSPRLGPSGAVAPGAVERAFDAAAQANGAMPPSWTTFRLVPTMVDAWQAGTDTRPPSRTRYLRTAAGWDRFPVLP
jgi:pyridoxamine 5'-phosphate oxidase